MLIAELSIHLITYIPHAYFSEVLLGVVTCKKECCMGREVRRTAFGRIGMLLSYLYASRLLTIRDIASLRGWFIYRLLLPCRRYWRERTRLYYYPSSGYYLLSVNQDVGGITAGSTTGPLPGHLTSLMAGTF
jgi:hypothetical protein